MRKDQWLNNEVEMRINNDILGKAIALSMKQRLHVYEPGEARATVQKLLAGETIEELSGARNWISSLRPDQLTYMEALAEVSASCLWHDINDHYEEGVDTADACASESWQAHYIYLCQERDELEGVAGLLEEIGRGDGVSGLLEAVDHKAQVCFGSLPIEGVKDEHLSRARTVSFDSWWTARVS